MIKTLISGILGVPRGAWLAIIALVGGVALWVTILTGQVSEGRSQIKALSTALSASEAEVEQLRNIRAADTVAANVYEKELAAIKAKEAITNAKLEKALKANPQWANQPVPRDVAGSLQP